MAGIYLHIPFCQKACIYCDFHFSTLLKNKPVLVDAIAKELEQRKQYLGDNLIETIYIGGGTPTLLNENEFRKLFEAIHKNYSISNSLEVTVEANPDDLSSEKLKLLKELGVNRLSIGVQSFHEEHLQLFNRSHNSNQAIESIKLAQDFGIDNITIDLIYGFPQLTTEQLNENLEQVKVLNIPHLSAYALTVEPKTALHHYIKSKKFPNLDDTLAEEHFFIIRKFLLENGFHHYEISNFGKPNYYSKHNSNYWLGEQYLGVGPSAHSFNLNSRSWNVANNKVYINKINSNETYYELEELSEKDRLNELILTGLRTKWGVQKSRLKQFSQDLQKAFLKELAPFLKNGEILETKNSFVLADKFWFKADGIAAQLFQV